MEVIVRGKPFKRTLTGGKGTLGGSCLQSWQAETTRAWTGNEHATQRCAPPHGAQTLNISSKR